MLFASTNETLARLVLKFVRAFSFDLKTAHFSYREADDDSGGLRGVAAHAQVVRTPGSLCKFASTQSFSEDGQKG